MARKILLADDSVTAQNMGRKILTDAGYEVVTVNNGSSALKKINESRPDLIVVDVYMPGYSGLEVCQRVKEARETSEIPVLLTVGKLEPFKQDEARRVRADAFIIKPFEASELLAALNRLEDRIVASSSSSSAREGRPGSRLEKLERFSETELKYGDQDAGWKARLPGPASRLKVADFNGNAEPDAQEALSKAGFRDLLPAQPERAANANTASSIFERFRPTDVPQDITADEIAALTAAAARVSVGKDFERLAAEPADRESEGDQIKRPAVGPKPGESAPTSSAIATQSSPKPAAEAELKIDARPLGPLDRSRPAQLSPSLQESSPVPTAWPTLPASAQASLSAQAVSDAPSNNGHHQGEAVAVQAMNQDGQPALQSVEAATAGERATMAVGTRWIAEEAPLVAEESRMVLEHEMHKAFAAFAAADAARAYETAPIDRDEEPVFALVAPPSIGEPLPGGENPSSSATETSVVAPIAGERVPAAGISKPPSPPFAPANMATEESNHAVAAFGGPDPFAGPKQVAEAIATTQSAGPSRVSAMASENNRSAENAPREREAELAAATAAAWANWKEIRESVPGATAADSGQKTIEETTDPQEIKPLVEVASDSPENDSLTTADPSLSVIVDSMLAELKPKLMAELAKKLERKKE